MVCGCSWFSHFLGFRFCFDLGLFCCLLVCVFGVYLLVACIAACVFGYGWFGLVLFLCGLVGLVDPVWIREFQA